MLAYQVLGKINLLITHCKLAVPLVNRANAAAVRYQAIS